MCSKLPAGESTYPAEVGFCSCYLRYMGVCVFAVLYLGIIIRVRSTWLDLRDSRLEAKSSGWELSWNMEPMLEVF